MPALRPEILELLRGEAGVDEAWYTAAYPDVSGSGLEPAVHYFTRGWKERRNPRATFSTEGYLRENPDVAAAGMNPLVHFLRFGRAEYRETGLDYAPFPPDAREALQWRSLYERGLLVLRAGSAPPVAGRPFGAEGRPKIIFTGHEASRSGAPLLLLELMKAAAQRFDAEFFLFLEKDGPLLSDYAGLAHVIVNHQKILYRKKHLTLAGLLRRLAPPGPHALIVNSAGSARLLSEATVFPALRTAVLIHEMKTDISPEESGLIAEASDAVMFPSEATRRFWIDLDPRFEKGIAIHHGLRDPAFGKGDPEAARRRIGEELGIDAGAAIVLASGERSTLKGADLFLQVARRLGDLSGHNVHFIWLGSPRDVPARGREHWLERDARLMDLDSRVHFVETRVDVEPFHLAADIFAMTSRNDAFPFVVLEAMACRTPVVAFDNAGGAPEALAGGAGVTVPYLSVEAMAQAIAGLLADPERREAIGRRAEDHVRSRLRFDSYAEAVLSRAVPAGDAVRGDPAAPGVVPAPDSN